MTAYCDVPGCDDPKNPGFPRIAFRSGKCSSHMKQLQRTGQTTVIKEKLPIAERLLEVYGRYAEADGDDEFERAKREFRQLAKSLGREELSEALRRGIAAARAAGKRIGRPPKAERRRVREMFALLGSASVTAKVLKLSRATVYRYLSVSKTRVSRQPDVERPRRAG